MTLDAVLDLTPRTIWYLFSKSHELTARERLLLVSDLTAVAAPTQFKDGGTLRRDHLQLLMRQAGLRPND